MMNMIRDRIVSQDIRAVSYDAASCTLCVEFANKSIARHAPVDYAVYSTLVNSRFPKKIYRQSVMNQIPVVQAK
jgi:hypothetical protein